MAQLSPQPSLRPTTGVSEVFLDLWLFINDPTTSQNPLREKVVEGLALNLRLLEVCPGMF